MKIPYFSSQEIILPAGFFNINLTPDVYEIIKGYENVAIFCLNDQIIDQIGTLASIISVNKNILMVECVERVKLIKQGSLCEVEVLKDIGSIPAELYQDLLHSFKDLLKKMIKKLPSFVRNEFFERIDEIPADKLVYHIANILNLSNKSKLELLTLDGIKERAEKVNELVKNELSKDQQQNKRIRDFNSRDEISDLKSKLDNAQLPPDARSIADQELSRLRNISPSQPEYMVIKTYLDLISSLPWSACSTKTPSFIEAKKILNSKHFGMDSAKERSLQFIAVKKLSNSKSPILCLVGPPGTLCLLTLRSRKNFFGEKYCRSSREKILQDFPWRYKRRCRNKRT